MICPNCGAEYRPGFTRCHDCQVELVERLPSETSAASQPVEPSAPSRRVELVTVFTSNDVGRVTLAESLLRSAGIVFASRNRMVRDTAGWGPGDAYGLWPVEIQVDREDAEDARELLRDLEPQGRHPR